MQKDGVKLVYALVGGGAGRATVKAESRRRSGVSAVRPLSV